MTKKVSIKIFAGAFSTLLISGYLFAQNETVSDSSYATEKRILDKAIEYTGFADLPYFSPEFHSKPRMIHVEDDNTPFLHRHFTNSEVWLVTFNGIVITADENKVDSSHSRARDFDVFIDPETERLLKISSTKAEVAAKYKPLGSAKEREDCYRRARVTFSSDLPDTLPVPFSQVMKSCSHTPFMAQKIEAMYVFHEHPVLGAHRRWIVTLLGIPPIVPFGEGADSVPIEERSSTSIVVDAASGKPIGGVVPAY